MRFENRTIDKKINESIALASNLLTWESRLDDELTFKDDWKYDGIPNGTYVTCTLFSFPELKRNPVPVFTYKPFNPWTKAIAYFDGKAIHFNIRKLPKLSVAEITGTLLHEYAHYCGFTHGNNFKTKEKCLYSVPYFLSENVSRWL